jgi:N utilization substance protein B
MSSSSDAGFQNLSHARRKARHFGMQALYGWEMSRGNAIDIAAEFRVDNDMKGTDLEYFQAIVAGVIANCQQLDELFGPYLQDRSVAELDKVELALLRLASWELQQRIDTPFRVVINEAVTLARKFGATDSFKFINAVLDQVAAATRATEVAATKSS